MSAAPTPTPNEKLKVSPKIGPKKAPAPPPPNEFECDELLEIVRSLYQKYASDDYLKTKLTTHIKTTLPNMIQQKCDERNMREERRKTLEETSDEFIREFINSSAYYYNPTIDLFFVYQHNTYKIINEDEIEHDIRTTITDQQNPELSIWKYKIKNSIIKKIKERDLLSSIPESETIQRILNALTPFIFKNKDSAKYFLTIIGDILLRKNTNTYFIPSKTKHFITELSEESYALFGTPNMMNHIKFKFYEHKYEECRIIDVVENIISFPFYTHNEGIKIGLSHSMSSSSLSSLSNIVSSSGISTPKSPSHGHGHSSGSSIIQKQSMLDLFCVAAHYSMRFSSADLFIEKHCKDHAVRQHAFYLKNITDDEIMTKFISVTMEPCQNASARITWKNMLYLWKLFVEEEKIPNVFFTNVLKKHLMKRFEWICEPLQMNEQTLTSSNTHTEPQDTNQEIFLNVTSKHLPIVGKFMSFWNENITCNHTEIELEIDELSTLFLNYGNVYHGNQKNVQTITDQTILGFIRHFLPDICIEEDKYLMNIGCKLWDKKQEILACIEEFKKMHTGNRNVNGNGNENSAVSLKGKHKNKDAVAVTTLLASTTLPISFPVHTIYDFYCKWGYKCNKMVVSKRYFEKFFIDNYNEYLTEKNGTLWWNYL